MQHKAKCNSLSFVHAALYIYILIKYAALSKKRTVGVSFAYWGR